MYAQYATIYDLAQQGRFGERMAHWALDWLTARAETPNHVLDLACGSGAAALVFAQAGCAVVGVDQSADMLAIAQAKAHDAKLAVTFVQSDIRGFLTNDDRPFETRRQGEGETRTQGDKPPASSLQPPQQTTDNGHIDLITCFADSVNYLTEDGDLGRMFGEAAAALRSGGWLIFDINTEAEYTTWDERDVVACDNDELMLYQKLDFDPDTRIGTGKIGWLVREIDRWWRGEETHTQRSWSDDDVRTALDTAGLTLVLAEAAPDAIDDRRFLYVGRKL